MKGKRKLQVQLLSIVSSVLIVLSMVLPASVLAEGHADERRQGTIEYSGDKLSNRLLKEFDDQDKVTFLVKFNEKTNTEKVARDAAKDKKGVLSADELEVNQRQAVVSALKTVADKEQEDVLSYLKTEQEKDHVDSIHSYFVVNGIAVTATKEVAEKVSEFAEVEKVLPNEKREIVYSESNSNESAASETDGDVEWNVENVHAPEAWEEGFDGDGVVVANIDTGVEWNHPALKEKYRGYDGGTEEVNHDYNWFDAVDGKDEPYDDIEHGTHVMGTMVGSEPDGSNQIGVAPGAEWISVKAFSDQGGTDADLLKAAEWILAPTDAEGNEDVSKAPDVVNNSWGGGPGIDEWYREVVITWESANIFPEFSAGNVDINNPGGPGSVASPSNYPESFATGNVDSDNQLAESSLLGPSPYGDIKPDIAAPGENVRSAIPGGGYEGGWSGTSMAGPAVSATVALMKQANPDLNVAELKELLISSATPLTDDDYPETPNNAYGYGLVDAGESVSTVVDGLGTLKITLNNEHDDIDLDGTVTIEERDRTLEIDEDDHAIKIIHPVGDFTVKTDLYGYESDEQTVTIEKDQTSDIDVDLELLPQGSVEGVVTNESTEKPVEGAAVSLLEDGKITPVETNENGEYDLTGFAGEYTLQVQVWNYKTMEVPVTIEEDGTFEEDIALESNYTYPGEELVYDDGTYESSMYSDFAGSGWAVRMSLDEGQDEGYVTNGVFYLDDGYRPPGKQTFLVEVWDASGDNKEAEEKLAGPIEVEAMLEERNLNRVEVDLRDYNIKVEDDFYMVYIQDRYDYTVPSIAKDMDGKGYNRSKYYDQNDGWNEEAIPEGNFMIRANVAYNLEDVAIDTPERDIITNEESVSIEGTASPSTSVHLMNHDDEIDVQTVEEDGSFAFSADPDEGENEYQVLSKFDDDLTSKSETVQVIKDTKQPELTIDTPKSDAHTNKEAVTIKGTASDNYELEGVTVNGEQVDMVNEDFQQKVLLDDGENTIDVTAADTAGNETTETVTVHKSSDEPGISSLEPSTNISVLSGETVTISFNSDVKEGTASFDVSLPGQPSPQATKSHEMREVLPGFYKGEWTVPKGDISKAEVEVAITDQAGNTTTETADGTINVTQEKVNRIAGDIRYDTAVEISESGWNDADTVLLARGDNYADSLAGVPLAYQIDAPILLTPSDSIWENTLKEIERLGAENVIILGGDNAIHPSVETELEESGVETRRIEGDTRFETAANIASEMAPDGTDEAVVVNGLDFPDAMTVASFAAKAGQPILLAQDTTLPEATEKALNKLNVSETVIAGGTSVISETVENKLPKPDRLAGHDRYDTNIAVADHYGLDNNHVYVATGKEYADALTGAVLAAKQDSGMVLVHNRVPDVTEQFIHDASVEMLTLFGGDVAISQDVEEALNNIIP